MDAQQDATTDELLNDALNIITPHSAVHGKALLVIVNRTVRDATKLLEDEKRKR